METPLTELLEKSGDRVKAVLNILVESPYFYRTDNEELFFFLRRHRQEFAAFYDSFYGWTLLLDSKCARVYKPRWYNDAITEANRDLFGFRRRDECLGFMILLEFFEQQLEENAMTVEDNDELRFRFGDLLVYAHQRLQELFPDPAGDRYSEEHVRAHVLRPIIPVLIKYRFLSRVPPPAGIRPSEVETIFEALPALYHYNAGRLGQSIGGDELDGEE